MHRLRIKPYLLLYNINMDKFSNTDLHEIQNLEYYLVHCLVGDSEYNFKHKGEHQDKLSKIEDFVHSFIESLDFRRYHELRDRYNEYKNGESSLHMVLSYRKQELLVLLDAFREEYVLEAKKRLFSKVVSEMTGKELNEYLQLIGLLK